MKVNQKYLITDGNLIKKVSSGYRSKSQIKYIVIHETGNRAKTATALAHAKLQFNGNSRQASWHYTVDDKSAYKHFENTVICWHAGNANYNFNGIGIEMAVNHTDDSDYEKTLINTAELVASLMKLYNIPIDNVIQHNRASGKNCPEILRSGKAKCKINTWSEFISRCKNEYKELVNTGKDKVENVKTETSSVSEYYKDTDKVNKICVIGSKVRLYSDLAFKKNTGGSYPKNTYFTIVSCVHYKGNVWRFKTKSGYYVTANKNYVKKVN